MKKTPLYHALEDGASTPKGYKYTCSKCNRPYLDTVYKQDNPVCPRCFTGGHSNLPVIRGRKRQHGGKHTGKPGSDQRG